MHRLGIVILALASSAFGQRRTPAPPTLEIYWIDVEGGAATLIVGPNREALLVDAGFPGNGDRDAQRIAQAVVTAGLSRIDHLVITHYHGDHVGGVPGLAKWMPIRNFYDHGETVETAPNAVAQYQAYRDLAGTRRTILRPGDKILLGDVTLDIVSAGGKTIENRLERGFFVNRCEGAETKPEDKTENAQSVGFLLTYGRFSFLDLGDLTWDREMQLACPVNKIGEVSLLQATHHGFSNGQSGAPALVHSLRPQVVVVNNGARKGFSNGGYDTIAAIPGIEDIWQVHRGEANDAERNTGEEKIANLSGDAGEDRGYWIKAQVFADGSYNVMNARNRFIRTYEGR